jgi:alpha-1,2-mannosyltransferase
VKVGYVQRRARRDLRAFVETATLILPAFVGPALIVEYLLGKYHVHPLRLDGKYFPDGGFLFDLHVMWKAGHDIVTGHSPYPFVYPAPAAILMIPFGLLPWKAAVVAFTLFVIGAFALMLRLLGVRDWRCYFAPIAALPVLSSITIGTLSTAIALGAAIAWRFRNRRWASASAVAALVVIKLFLWPLGIWLIATRRFRTAALAVVVAPLGVIICWALLGFSGMLDYPRFLRHVASLEQARSYSPFAVFTMLGASNGTAHVLLLVLTPLALGAIFVAARGPDGDRRSFAVALGVSLALSPIVWMHYLVLVYVVVAVYQRRFGAAWVLPIVYWVLPGQDSNGSLTAIVIAYALTAATIAFAVLSAHESNLRVFALRFLPGARARVEHAGT